MKFYVAGKFGERGAIRELMNKLEANGHTITKDWTVDEEDVAGFPIINVVEDIYGIRIADAYIGVFLNEHNYKGALVEMGVSLGLRKPTYIIGHATDACVFNSHPLVKQFDTIGDFLIWAGAVI